MPFSLLVARSDRVAPVDARERLNFAGRFQSEHLGMFNFRRLQATVPRDKGKRRFRPAEKGIKSGASGDRPA